MSTEPADARWADFLDRVRRGDTNLAAAAAAGVPSTCVARRTRTNAEFARLYEAARAARRLRQVAQRPRPATVQAGPRGFPADTSWHEAFLADIAAGSSVRTAAANAGVAEATAYAHQRTTPAFAAAVTAAQARRNAAGPLRRRAAPEKE